MLAISQLDILFVIHPLIGFLRGDQFNLVVKGDVIPGAGKNYIFRGPGVDAPEEKNVN